MWPCLSACRNAEKWIFIREPRRSGDREQKRWEEGVGEERGLNPKDPGERLKARYVSGIKIKGGGAQILGRNKISNRVSWDLNTWKHEHEMRSYYAFALFLFLSLSLSLSLSPRSIRSLVRSPYRGSWDCNEIVTIQMGVNIRLEYRTPALIYIAICLRKDYTHLVHTWFYLISAW